MSYFNNITNKQKLYLLFAGLLMMSYIIYHRSISPTLQAYSKFGIYDKDIEKAKTAEEQLILLEHELSNMKNMIGETDHSVAEIHQQLLGVVGNYCKQYQVILKKFYEPHQFDHNEMIISTNRIEVEGNYTDILQLIHQLEKNFKSAKVSAVKFYSKEQLKTKKLKLYAVIYIQNINAV